MRLIGGRDYYDNGLAYGRDESITFVRHRADQPQYTNTGKIPDVVLSGDSLSLKDIRTGKSVVPYWAGRSRVFRVDRGPDPFNERDIVFRKMTVLIAGKRYNGFNVIDSHVDHPFWRREDLDEYFMQNGVEISNEKEYSRLSDNQRMNEWFDMKISQSTYDWMMEKRATVVFATYSRGPYREGSYSRFYEDDDYYFQIDTDCLKTLEFYRRMGAVEAFQEIQMWVGGTLPRPGPPMVEITDDKMKAAKHGMDKWSFRKMPEK